MKKDFTPTEEEIEYMKSAAETPNSEMGVPWYKSYPAAAGRGILKGVISFGEMLGPTDSTSEREEAEKQREAVFDKVLPIGDEPGPRGIERGIKAGTETVAFPGSTIGTGIKSSIGGLGAQVVKEMGGPKWLETLVEVGPHFTPNLNNTVRNRLPTQAARAENALAQDARNLGLTEQELALTLNQRGMTKDFLTEIAAKGGRTVDRFDRTRAALGRVWNNLRTTPDAQRSLNGQQSAQLVNNMSQRLSRLPAEQRNRIMTDYNDLLGSQMRGEDIIDFWQKMNYYINSGDRGLGVLKEDLLRGLSQISPELARDFNIANQLYGNFHRLAERMGPNVAESLIRAGENGIVLSAITTGNYPLLKKVLGPLAARQLATEMTTNPRMMNLSSKFINSIERGLPTIARKVYDEILFEVGKMNGEAAMKLSNFDVEKYFDALPDEDEYFKALPDGKESQD